VFVCVSDAVQITAFVHPVVYFAMNHPGIFEVPSCLLVLTQFKIRRPEIVQDVTLFDSPAGLARDCLRLLVVFERLLVLADVSKADSDIVIARPSAGRSFIARRISAACS